MMSKTNDQEVVLIDKNKLIEDLLSLPNVGSNSLAMQKVYDAPEVKLEDVKEEK